MPICKEARLVLPEFNSVPRAMSLFRLFKHCRLKLKKTKIKIVLLIFIADGQFEVVVWQKRKFTVEEEIFTKTIQGRE